MPLDEGSDSALASHADDQVTFPRSRYAAVRGFCRPVIDTDHSNDPTSCALSQRPTGLAFRALGLEQDSILLQLALGLGVWVGSVLWGGLVSAGI